MHRDKTEGERDKEREGGRGGAVTNSPISSCLLHSVDDIHLLTEDERSVSGTVTKQWEDRRGEETFTQCGRSGSSQHSKHIQNNNSFWVKTCFHGH